MIENKNEFGKFFSNKGNIAPIAEKAKINFEVILKNPINTKNRIHHFAIGHAFKDIKTKSLFKYELKDNEKLIKPTQYLSLQSENFDFQNELFKVIDNIRNINCHFVHTFDCLNLEKLTENSITNSKINQFLKESFEVAIIVNYLNEKSLTYEQFTLDNNSQRNIVYYLCDKFYPNEIHQKDQRAILLKLNKNELIDKLLFIEVYEEFEWKMKEDHKIFTIDSGKYLSFNSCLFLLSLFLYKDEANSLISKIRGFKKTEDKFNYKRNIFTLFSKKFSSKDINSEEKYLIRFRDIISYLNHYPLEWNKHLELESEFPKMTDLLKKKIIELEIFRSFKGYEDSPDRRKFLQYAAKMFFGITFYTNEDLNISSTDKENFNYEINTSPELKNINTAVLRLENKGRLNNKEQKELDKLNKKKKILEKESNSIKEKLAKRIKENTLIRSYGRNQDRFMQIATRFLAEENYFGEDAKFKLYQFYSTSEQEEFCNDLRKNNESKRLDKLNYHQGKLTYYSTFEEHLKKYNEWDTPFVIQNNAIKLKITLNNGIEKLLTIQRSLMIYLFEHALYNEKTTIHSEGKLLLENYFLHYNIEVEKGQQALMNNNTISKESKNKLKSFFPNRLLHHYSPAQQNFEPEVNSFENILQKSELQEVRYNGLLLKAQKLNLEAQFLEKNKGKQFKLNFIRKAWHLMFFKSIYLEQSAINGHHKSFHITKDQFNDFSKWMFAFDEIPRYKEFLKILFEEKLFLKNIEFKNIFEQSNSISDLYQKTKSSFSNWLKSNVPQNELDKYNFENYKNILHKTQWYINLSDFIKFLESKNLLIKSSDNIYQYKSLYNSQYLISDYYYSNILLNDEYKTHGKLYNKLRKQKLEDALLYELAVRYLNVDSDIVKEAKCNITKILTNNFTFEIKDSLNNQLYQLIVPFNKLESLAVLINHKVNQESNIKFGKTSFLGNLNQFLNISTSYDLKDVIKQKKEFGFINFDHLNKVYNHIISGSILFTRIEMKLEEYFISKFRIEIPFGQKYIDWEEIKDNNGKKLLTPNYFNKRGRNKAFHFGVPTVDYKEQGLIMENYFIKTEIKPNLPSHFQELDELRKSVCKFFMDVLHNDNFKKIHTAKFENLEEKKERFKKEKIQFENTYFSEIICS